MRRLTLLALAALTACSGRSMQARRGAVFRSYVAAVNASDVARIVG